ncbi:MAG: YolD-like family protein [Lawsonibacter sp.]|nr:YolD-like family protein [Lawsonibacter sp.]
MTDKYDDIIDLPHHVSATYSHMSMSDRAAQFQPFRALTGYEDTIQETARLTDKKIELTEEQKAILDSRLQELADRIRNHPRAAITYFQPDKKKNGGAYICITGQLKKMDVYAGVLILVDGKRISIDDILNLQLI